MRTSYQSISLCSIIVTYQTKINEFRDIIKCHEGNFSNIIIINNSPEISLDSFKSSQVKVINNPDNIGLAFALNVGIIEAKKEATGFKTVQSLAIGIADLIKGYRMIKNTRYGNV